MFSIGQDIFSILINTLILTLLAEYTLRMGPIHPIFVAFHTITAHQRLSTVKLTPLH